MSKIQAEKKPPKAAPTIPADMSVSDVVKYVEDQYQAIRNATTYDNTEVQNSLQNIGKVYFQYKKSREPVSALLIKLKFPEHAVKMLNYFNNVGVFKDDQTWFPCYYTMNTLWNYTDASKELGKEVTDAGLLPILIKNLSHQPYKESASSKNVFYILKSSLSICQNIASKVPESKNEFHKENGVEVFKAYLESDDDFLKALSVLTLSAIVDETENAVLETGAIPFICNSMKLALNNDKRRHRGFTPTELCQGLGRMAVNDNNKKKTVEAGALPLFVMMMKFTDEEEQEAAARTTWTLAFDKEVQENIKKEPNMVEALKKISNSANSRVKKAAKGALWKLEGEQKHQDKKKDEPKAASEKNIPHVFISYNWGHQETIVKLANKLKEDGFKVWIDVDLMEGSTLEAMALAVENAAVVVIGVSEKYKLSPNCRTEAEYTFQLKKPIVPIMMQRHYRADGWLGMLLGSKLYINFDGKFTFEHAYGMFLKELKDRGRLDGSGTENAIVAAPSGTASAPKETKQSKVAKWSCGEVNKWMNENASKNLSKSMNNYDGKKVVSLQKLRIEAPEFFYRCLDEKLKMSVAEILEFTDLLDQLL